MQSRSNRNGNLRGIITEATINRTYYHVQEKISLLALPVTHCQTRPVTISPNSDVFEALDLLKNEGSIVVVEDDKPVGILTHFDTTNFFRDVSEGLILVEDIEVTLRQYIESAFPSEDEMQQAIKSALGQERDYHHLSFWHQMKVVMAESNWEKFQPVFQSKDLFSLLLNQVRQIRNQLAHFRGRLDLVQQDALLRARDWLAARPKLSVPSQEGSIDIVISGRGRGAAQVSVGQRPSSKYAPLTVFLSEIQAHSITLDFDRIKSGLDVELPTAAYQHRSWWENDYTTNLHSLAWLSAGWRVEDVDLSSEQVILRQTISVLQQLFFADLLERLKRARPGLTRATKTQPQSWWSFGGGKAGFGFAWAFTKDSELRVELYIDTGSQKDNKAAFDALCEQKTEIEKEIGIPLNWQRLDDKRASRISLARPASLDDPPEQQEATKQWALETMLKFVDAFQPRIKDLR
jgi:hypothetical protein